MNVCGFFAKASGSTDGALTPVPKGDRYDCGAVFLVGVVMTTRHPAQLLLTNHRRRNEGSLRKEEVAF